MDKKRFYPAVFGFIAIGLVFIFALVYIQIFKYDFYREKAENQQRRYIKIAPDRGDIFSRDGAILATSLNTYSIYVDPRKFTDYQKLSLLLGEKVDPISDKKYFAWIKRKITHPLAQKIEEAKIPGLQVIMEKKRVYPNGNLASQVLGFVGVDNKGLAGIELALDHDLRAKEGWIKTYADPVGYEFLRAKSEKIDVEEEGLNVVLTIDQRIQYAAERELEAAVKKFGAISGTAIIMDVETGDILALASKPDFDPNNYSKFSGSLWNSRACSVYEPGSTFKVITVAAALDEGVVNLDTKLKKLETITVGGKVISNAHAINWPGDSTSLSFMLEQSVNTGAVQVAQKLGKEKFYKAIRGFGFGDKTGFGLDGESRGILQQPQYWYAPDIAMMSFGQSIAVTPVQLVAAFASFANGGEIIKPHLIKRIESRDGSYIRSFPARSGGRAVSRDTAEKVMRLMENVVVLGTGKPSAIKNFNVAGKTGTAQKTVPGGVGYMKGHYVGSFVGIAPAKNPKLCSLVIIDDPKGTIWGATTAGPVFKRIITEALRYLNVRPDAI